MKLLLTVAAILAWVFGVALLLAPGHFYAPLDIEMSPLIATAVAKAHGATLVGLGVINWLARDADRKGLIAVLTGNLLVQILSFLVVLQIMRLGTVSAAVPAMVIHLVLGGLFLFFLLQVHRRSL